MKTPLALLAGALIAASLPALADNQAGAGDPEDAIPDNLPRIALPGPYDDFTKQVQQKLDDAGFDPGPINGNFGEKTQAALAQYQLANLLPASGMPDDVTLDFMGIERPSTEQNAAVGSSGGEPAPAQTSD
jgi:peptidoglycan hydrolase-like protein with peptidoglycan-binding domain